MYVLLISSEQLDGFYSCSGFRSSSIIGQGLVDMSILSPKVWGPKNKMAIFSEVAIMIWITFQQFMRNISLNETV
jgi:hypothetical protein